MEVNRPSVTTLWIAAAAIAAAVLAPAAYAHAIGGKDAAFVAATSGPDPLPFMYLGAKHMVTGYDHLLFLLGVIFFLYRMKDVLLYVSLFSLGHSTTLLIGVSVSYKAFENLGGFRRLGVSIDNRIAVGGFGLIHGFGLATKLQDLDLNPNGLVENLVAFNIGVEIGQLVALSMILAAMTLWRTTKSFPRFAVAANALLFLAGVVLAGQQLAGFFIVGEG